MAAAASASTATENGGLTGMHALVTGGASGNGAAVACRLAQAGAHVTTLDLADATVTMERIRARGGAAASLVVDVSDRNAVIDTVAAAATTHGRLDVAVTAAGIYGNVTSIDDVDEKELKRVLDVNFAGALWTVQASLAHMRGRGGQIVCVGSVAGKIGGVLAGPHYAASKGAVHALVRWLAKSEAGNGIRANGVAPGAVDTPMIAGKGYPPAYCPLGRFAEPSEIAEVVSFLASPASSYMTGTVVDVNGGYYFS